MAPFGKQIFFTHRKNLENLVCPSAIYVSSKCYQHRQTKRYPTASGGRAVHWCRRRNNHGKLVETASFGLIHVNPGILYFPP